MSFLCPTVKFCSTRAQPERTICAVPRCTKTIKVEKETTHPLGNRKFKHFGPNLTLMMKRMRAYNRIRMEVLLPRLRTLREGMISIAVLDRVLATLAMACVMVLGWFFFNFPSIERRINKWDSSVSVEDLAIKYQIKVVAFSAAFFVSCFAYTLIMHNYIMKAIDKKMVKYLWFHLLVDSCTLVGKTIILIQLCSIFDFDINVQSLIIIPLGYQMITATYLSAYIFYIYRAKKLLQADEAAPGENPCPISII